MLRKIHAVAMVARTLIVVSAVSEAMSDGKLAEGSKVD